MQKHLKECPHPSLATSKVLRTWVLLRETIVLHISYAEKSITFYICKLIDLLQVTFHLASKSLKIPVEDLVIIPYFECWYSRWNLEDKLDVFLPTTPEFQDDISILADLINYATKQVTDLPSDFCRTFQLVRLADFLGMDSFLELCADQLDVPTAELWNSNSIRKVRGLIRGCFRAHRANSKTTDKIKCPVCQNSITRAIPLKADWVETPCCMKAIHHTCYKDAPACIACHQQLQVLPCAVCRANIFPEGTTFHERYKSTSKKQLVCCGADCHLECARSLAGSKCPVCRTPLKLSGVRLPQSTPLSLKSDNMEWWHYIDMRKEMRYNDLRRQKGLSYDVHRPDLVH